MTQKGNVFWSQRLFTRGLSGLRSSARAVKCLSEPSVHTTWFRHYAVGSCSCAVDDIDGECTCASCHCSKVSAVWRDNEREECLVICSGLVGFSVRNCAVGPSRWLSNAPDCATIRIETPAWAVPVVARYFADGSTISAKTLTTLKFGWNSQIWRCKPGHHNLKSKHIWHLIMLCIPVATLMLF